LTQAMTTGANVVATACPYCLQMLEDAARGEDTGESVAIKDVAEILADAVLVGPTHQANPGLGGEPS